MRALGELDNTYFFLTSDHGFHFHELRLGVGKWSVYETDVRVPMLVAGPGIAPNSSAAGLVGSHIDLAPTWMELAGIARPGWMDGRSVAAQLLGEEAAGGAEEEAQEPGRRGAAAAAAAGRPANAAYIEYHGLGPVGAPGRLLDSFNNTFRGVRLVGGPGAGPRFSSSPNLLYAEWGSDFLFSSVVFRELYDMDSDPWQLTNLYGEWSHTHKHLVDQVANLTLRLYNCAGASCL